MANRKLAKYLAVSALLACGLTGCDDVEAKPSNQSSDLIAFVDSVYGNSYESISDSYHAEIASKTLDDILYTYAVNVVGAYNANVAANYAKKVTVGGKAIDASSIVTISDVIANESKLAEFVSAHPAYNVGDAAAQKALVNARYYAMKASAAKKMFAKIAAATTDNKFNEKDLLVSLYDSTGKVTNPYKLTAAEEASLTKDYIVTPDKKAENVFTDGILHEGFYTQYIDEEIMPDIYRDALVQQYIFEQQEKTLGSSSARKINYVTIKYDDLDESLYADKLIKGFVTDYLISDNVNVTNAFNLLSSTWNGEFMNGTEAEIKASPEWNLLKSLDLVDANDVAGDIIEVKNSKPYIKGSAYGDLVEDYAKLDDNPSKSTATRDYTGGNKYVKEIGFEIESDKIALNDHVTDGWFIKSSSEISSLPDSIKNRLFNLSVATGKNNGTAATITKTVDGITVSDGNKYIAKNGNNYFLRNSNLKANQDPYESIIFNDTSAHTYYIINVEEAVSANYMTTDAAKANYALRIDVASLLSSNDTNINLSKKHWLEKCDITYHDQSVYDYFESNFPELFADD
ncbi:MAG: hypothetical protein MJZ37_02950 [Bacilli bacterium]|nr:hypothetical protein [Bacilli bacterium]